MVVEGEENEQEGKIHVVWKTREAFMGPADRTRPEGRVLEQQRPLESGNIIAEDGSTSAL